MVHKYIAIVLFCGLVSFANLPSWGVCVDLEVCKEDSQSCKSIRRTLTVEYKAKIEDGKVVPGEFRDVGILGFGYNGHTTERLYDISGRLTKESYINPDNDYIPHRLVSRLYRYDKAGRKVSHRLVNALDTIMKEETWSYDPQGRLLCTTNYEYYDLIANKPPSSSCEKYTYFYSPQGLLDSCSRDTRSRHISTTVYTYTFHPNGSVKTRTARTPKVNQRPERVEILNYTELGVLSFGERINISEGKEVVRYKDIYDSLGRITEIRSGDRICSSYQFNSQGRQTIFRVYDTDNPDNYEDIINVYDNQGNRIVCVVVEHTPTLRTTEVLNEYVYVAYDRCGNWIERIEYSRGKPSEITKREIEYY